MRPDRRTFLSTAAALGAHALTAGRASAQSTTLDGIDVSHWQGSINWTQVQNSGKSFAFCKATQDTTYKDPTFDTNWVGMKSVGLLRSAYHYAIFGGDTPANQASFFVNTVKPQNGDLPLVVDLEWSSNTGATPAQVWPW